MQAAPPELHDVLRKAVPEALANEIAAKTMSGENLSADELAGKKYLVQVVVETDEDLLGSEDNEGSGERHEGSADGGADGFIDDGLLNTFY